jgi:O-acetyl-ADP-ribose deacetylase (regulator of RNase III)
MMEYFPAMDANAVKACMDRVDESEIYIGIFAHRYGFIPEGQDISITEMEFNRAGERNIPRLCFLIDDNHPWSPQFIEDGAGKEKLIQFKQRINANFVRGTFTTAENLALQILKALGALKITPPAEERKAEYVQATPSSSTLKVSTRRTDHIVNGKIFRLSYGDIIENNADVLVSSDDNTLSLSAGVARSLAEGAGEAWLRNEVSKYKNLNIGDVVVTSGGNLSARYIFHPVTIAYKGQTLIEKPLESSIQLATFRCLRLADALGVRTITFPALATGSVEFPPQFAASAMSRAIADHFLLGETGLKMVTITLLPGSSDAFKALFQQIILNAVNSRELKREMYDLKAKYGSKEPYLDKELAELEIQVNEAVTLLSTAPKTLDEIDALRQQSGIDQIKKDFEKIKKRLGN